MSILHRIKRLLPAWLLARITPPYHLTLAWLGSIYYRHPSRDICVIGVTGTKGKSSVTELLTSILRQHGCTVASVSTIQFRIGDTVERNLYKMTMPGRFFLQSFLRRAVDADCSHAIIEMTSEGAKLNRHRFIDLDALIFTNLTPEHIESHGSFAAYKAAKLRLVTALEQSPKRPRYLIVNSDDEHGNDFLKASVEHRLPYTLNDLTLYSLHKDSISLVFGERTIRVPLVGKFNVYNTLAAITMARALDVSWNTIEQALRNHAPIKGRVEQFTSPRTASKHLTAVVDYAHTPDSLKQLYEAFPNVSKVCVLGNTGGGRDTWKRPEMATIAEQYCEQIILTNEDPYDEDPKKILSDMQSGITNHDTCQVILDRTEAIRTALALVPAGGYVLISGKGTDPYIMGPNGSKTPWSDAEVVQRLLQEL